MTTFCTFCGEQVETECPYEGLCAAGLSGQPITTIPKSGYIGTPRQKPKQAPPQTVVPLYRPFNRTPEPKNGKHERRPIAMYNLYGEKLAVFPSFREAARKMNFFVTAIRQCVLGEIKNSILLGGAIFLFEEREKTIMVRYVSHYRNGKEIDRYGTAADAARAVGRCEKQVRRELVGVYKNKAGHLDTFKFNYLFL